MTLESQFEEVFRKADITQNPDLSNLVDEFSSNPNGRTQSSFAFDTDIGTLQLDQIVERIANEDQVGANYSIKLIPPSDVRGTIEYLVLTSQENGYVGYILQFEPTAFGDSFFQNFTGTLRALDLNRSVQSEEYFENGVQVEPDNSAGRTSTLYEGCDCAYVFDPVTGPITGGTIGYDVVIECKCSVGGGGNSGGTGGGSEGIGTPVFGPGSEESSSGGSNGGGNNNGGGGTGETIGFGDLEECTGTNQTYNSNGDCITCEFGVDNGGLCHASDEDAWEEDHINDSNLKPA